jgi:hypothetical protein
VIGRDWWERARIAGQRWSALRFDNHPAVSQLAKRELRALAETDWAARAREGQAEYECRQDEWLLGDEPQPPTIAEIDREFGPPSIKDIARLACEARMPPKGWSPNVTDDDCTMTTLAGSHTGVQIETPDVYMALAVRLSGAENRARIAAYKERATDLARHAELHAAAAKDRAAVVASARAAAERMIAAEFTDAAGKLTLRGRRADIDDVIACKPGHLPPDQFWMKRQGLWVKHDLAGAIALYGGLPYGVEVRDIINAVLDILDEREAA